MILEHISSPKDLKALDGGSLVRLCGELRNFLVESVARTGGHLASNLGAVELTVALHRVYDTERDRLVFDVGHQCYVHKALTGRRELFGSLRQLGVVQDFVKGFRGERTLVMVDPVMGDHGKTYRTYTPEMCREMEALARAADIITPNMTEAAILLHEPYDKAPDSEQGWREWVERLSLNGSRSVILTGIEPEKGMVGAACFDRETGEMRLSLRPEIPGYFHGTGDLFSSTLLCGLLNGMTLYEACDTAVEFTHRTIVTTAKSGGDTRFGPKFETHLPWLARQMEEKRKSCE